VFDPGYRGLGMIVGYDVAREDGGEVVNSGETYVLPAARGLEQVKGLRQWRLCRVDV